jgi:hypothetical protein
MKKIYMLLIMSVLLISLASAADLTYKKDTVSDLKVVCINNGFCSSSAFCNVTVFNPDATVIVDAQTATQASSLAYHNITLSANQLSKLGEYTVSGFCKDGSINKEINFIFTVTDTGKPVSTAAKIIYPILFIAVMGLMFYLMLRFLTAFAQLEVCLRDLIIYLIAYLTFVFFYLFAYSNYADAFILGVMDIFLYVFGFMFLILPPVGIIFSWVKNGGVN